MPRNPVVNLFALALLFAMALLARAPAAAAETVRDTQTGAKAPSVVMQAFRQGQVGTGPNRAALVVRYGDGSVQTRCVRFEEPEIGGDELLDRSGLNPVFGLSLEVCSINGEGCPSDDCFCQCPFPNCEYWAYYHWQGGAWQYSEVGASGYGVKDGDLEGWSWGPGNFSQATPPPVMTFDQICNPPTQASPTPPSALQSGGAPTILSFTAQPESVQPQGCATLSWSIVNVASVLLDGVSVGAQGTQQVCPSTTRTYALVAASAAGQQVTQTLTVQVTGAPAGSAQATATPTATVTTGAPSPTPAWTPALPDVVRSGLPTPAYITPFPAVPQQPQPEYSPGQAREEFPAPDPGLSPLAAPELVGGVPLAPTPDAGALDQLPLTWQGPAPTATRYTLARPATETPRPRRVLGQDGRPTPTPILIARSGAGPAPGAADATERATASAARDNSRPLLASRAFTDALLPQYAAYLATLTILVAMGWFVHRRRSVQPSAASQPAREPERAPDHRFANKDERAAQ